MRSLGKHSVVSHFVLPPKPYDVLRLRPACITASWTFTFPWPYARHLPLWIHGLDYRGQRRDEYIGIITFSTITTWLCVFSSLRLNHRKSMFTYRILMYCTWGYYSTYCFVSDPTWTVWPPMWHLSSGCVSVRIFQRKTSTVDYTCLEWPLNLWLKNK